MPRIAKFFKRAFADDLNGHGSSVWLFEVGDDAFATKQLEMYDDGTTLAYDMKHSHDAFGMLADQPFDLDEFAPFEISPAEFERWWVAAEPANRTSAKHP